MKRILNKRQKRAALQEIALLTDREGWESELAVVERVERLGKIVSNESMGTSNPLPPLDFEKLNPDNFLYMRMLGYLVTEIRNACGVSNTMMQSWIRENELTRKHIDYSELMEWKFNNKSKKLPLKGVEKMPVITKEKINEFLQDGGWSSSTQGVYRGRLNIFLSFMKGEEITTKKIDTFLFSFIKNEGPAKKSDIKSVLLKYLKWIGFDYNQQEERVIDVYKKTDEKSVSAPKLDKQVELPAAVPEKTALLLHESEKTCILLGKGFMKIDFREKDVSISLDYLEATDLSEKKDQALKIAAEFGGQIVKIQTRTILAEVD